MSTYQQNIDHLIKKFNSTGVSDEERRVLDIYWKDQYYKNNPDKVDPRPDSERGPTASQTFVQNAVNNVVAGRKPSDSSTWSQFAQNIASTTEDGSMPNRYNKTWDELNDHQKNLSGSKIEHSKGRIGFGFKTGGKETLTDGHHPLNSSPADKQAAAEAAAKDANKGAGSGFGVQQPSGLGAFQFKPDTGPFAATPTGDKAREDANKINAGAKPSAFAGAQPTPTPSPVVTQKPPTQTKQPSNGGGGAGRMAGQTFTQQSSGGGFGNINITMPEMQQPNFEEMLAGLKPASSVNVALGTGANPFDAVNKDFTTFEGGKARRTGMFNESLRLGDYS